MAAALALSLLLSLPSADEESVLVWFQYSNLGVLMKQYFKKKLREAGVSFRNNPQIVSNTRNFGWMGWNVITVRHATCEATSRTSQYLPRVERSQHQKMN